MTNRIRAARARAEWQRKPFARLGALVGFAIVVSALGGWTKRVRAADEVAAPTGDLVLKTVGDLRTQLTSVKGQIEVLKVQLDRAETLAGYSSRYQIPADLAASVYDVAISEGIDPALAFRLVHIESNFIRTAKSGASALGYTQVRLPTARFYQPGITETQLLDRETNLRMGFRFLRDLLNQYDGDPHLALLAYNRGPQRVNDILAEGGDPANGYSAAVLKGIKMTRRTTR